MLFNSLEYLFFFLPLVLALFYILRNTVSYRAAKLWLVFASFAFYSYWKPEHLPLILASICINFSFAKGLCSAKLRPAARKLLFLTGCAFNLLLLCYFKYLGFILENIPLTTDLSSFSKIILPLGISFFTFQQIAYLADCYASPSEEYSFSDYCLFIAFFPQLIAGPIVHHKEMMPQFEDSSASQTLWTNMYSGLFFLSLGLVKKLGIADSFATIANAGYSAPDSLNFLTAWGTSLSYTIQLYCDFSGYTDMAIGSALLFGIRLPINFNSPYASLDIQDFWRRWHITLGRFLRDYIYIPLGGSRKGFTRTLCNLFLTFLIGGLWHGAGWTFILWGAMHGAALVIHRIWKAAGHTMPKACAWLVTFFFVHCAWVIFRAPTVQDAFTVLHKMILPTDIHLAPLSSAQLWILPALLYVLFDTFFKNSQRLEHKLSPRLLNTAVILVLFWCGAGFLLQQNHFSEFLYFQF
ncbi:MBOAT family O-acyltransferase [Desulfobaculum bizertense]|uniref:D-alanyl-lipoteichoic acid acyltransferase DltB, MBOAT superfamily n=1 Tax=Desulfobaculum bizertense DSM 18034 TaxID=1121442 RepID=A0A1T4VQD6_9BACT|nr:MBOAT family protein [Desulfobaculum bizertense]SKA67203.1 D-alanyl-lipoteichoic acid acyltransferase DltB, MBOAT superfamily [Desulfobaculum bizertense DSM 18034]